MGIPAVPGANPPWKIEIMRLENKQVVLIGGSSGIGLATAKLATAEGATVTIAGRSADRLGRAVDELVGSKSGSRVRSVAADMTDGSTITELFDRESRVDHVFVTAGEFKPGAADLLKADLDALRLLLETQVIGLAHVVRSVREKLAEGGSIVLMSGLTAIRPRLGLALGAGTVAAIEGMTRALALDLAPIRVNAVAPGLIDTPFFDNFGPDWPKIAAEAGRKLPVCRIGRADDVAEAAVFLMTNGYVTGTVLRIDGGASLV